MKAIQDFEKELEEIGLEIVGVPELGDNPYPHWLCIQVDLDTEVDYSELLSQVFGLKKLTKRKDFFFINMEYNKEIGRLTLFVWTPVSEEIASQYKSTKNPIATTFPDLCWYYSEGTTGDSINEVETKIREEAKLGDLSWYMPSRMIDNFIEIMHTMNHTFLQGLMQDTICYGVFSSTRRE